MHELFSLRGDDIARMADEAVVETMGVAREAICRAQAIQVHTVARLARFVAIPGGWLTKLRSSSVSASKPLTVWSLR